MWWAGHKLRVQTMTHPFQAKIQPGDYVWRPYLFIHQEGTLSLFPPGTYLDIFCEIVSPEYEEDMATFRSRPDLRMAHCYSKVCVEGDLYQTVPLYVMIPITQRLFNTAKGRRWDLSLEHYVRLAPDGAVLIRELAEGLLSNQIKGLDYHLNVTYWR